jgi:DNA-binding transcriptional ArsR family regulator
MSKLRTSVGRDDLPANRMFVGHAAPCRRKQQSTRRRFARRPSVEWHRVLRKREAGRRRLVLTRKCPLAYDGSVGDVFKALADPTRRKILDELAERDGQTLFELCSRLATKHQLALTRQAISQHLDVLEAAGLVKSRREGRYKFHDLETAPLATLTDRWLRHDRTETR